MITITAALKSLRLVLISVILLSMNLGLFLTHFFGLGWDTADLSYNYGSYSTGDKNNARQVSVSIRYSGNEGKTIA